jgi:tRNA threonylcarbamoyladenosine biosynthesis protein TsaB
MSRISQTVLAIDTSNHLTLALLETDGLQETLALQHSEDVGRAHAEIILERIQELFARANLRPHADLIAVGTGPGSYTGLRVGASLALGLARAWNATVIGVPSLEAIAVTRDGLVTVSMDARRGNVYSASYLVAAGTILEVLEPIAKRPLEGFVHEEIWLRDQVVNGLEVGRLGIKKSSSPDLKVGLEVMYL